MAVSANRPFRLGRTSMVGSTALIILQLQWQLAIVVADPTGTQCSQPEGRSDTCVCQTSDGVVDLTGLANYDGESARFTDLGPDPNQFMYTYNPCISYYGDPCYDQVYICQQSSDYEQTNSVTDGYSEQMWIDNDGTIYLYYTGPENRETRVNLHCDMSVKEPVVSTDGDSAVPLNYVFDITGCDVCPGGCDGGGGGGGGGGGKEKHKGGVDIGPAGIVVMTILIAGIVTYFVAGALIMKFHYKATGTDIIPNKKLWFALPLLLKDGCVLTFSPCVGLIRKKKDKYDEIPP